MRKFLLPFVLILISHLSFSQGYFNPERITNASSILGTHPYLFKDVNADGIDDIVVLKDEEFISQGAKRYIAFYAGTSSGDFLSAQILDSLPYLNSTIERIQFLDIDGDGDEDIVYSSTLREIGVFLNDGTGHYGPSSTLKAPIFGGGSFTMHPQFFDYDLDGDLDAFVNSAFQEFRLLVNNNMSLVDSTILFDGANIVFPHIGDFDNNGKIDVLAKKSGVDSLFIHYNQTSNGFANSPTALNFDIASPKSFKGIGDMDEDGDIDLIITEPGQINSYVYNGTSYSYQNLYNSGNTNNYVNIQFEDIDNNGWTDILATITPSNGYEVIDQVSAGNYSSSQIINDGLLQVNGGMVFKDVDNDGFKEMFNYTIFGDFGITVYDNQQGLLVFEENKLQLEFDNFDAGDLNDDGFIDLVKISSKSDAIQTLMNNGNDTYTIINFQLGIANDRLNAVKIGHFDTDNIPDLFIYEEDFDTIIESYVLLGQGNGQFASPFSLISDKRFILFKDINGDGLTDYFQPYYQDTANAGINTGGAFIINYSVYNSQLNNSVTPKLSNDKIEFLAFQDIVSSINPVLVYKSDANNLVTIDFTIYSATYWVIAAYPSWLNSPNLTGLYFNDWDNDGDLEAIYSLNNVVGSEIKYAEDLDFLFNGGPYDVNFQTAVTIASSLQDDFAMNELEKLDFNLDGNMDLIFTNRDYPASLYLLENFGGGNFNTPGLIDTRNAVENLRLHDFNADGYMDFCAYSSNSNSITKYESDFVFNGQALGVIYYDVNQNGVQDGNEIGMQIDGLQVNPTPGVYQLDTVGNYKLTFANTTQNYTLDFNHPHWQLVVPTSYNFTVDSNYTTTAGYDFGIVPGLPVDSVKVITEAYGGTCGLITNFHTTLTNVGNTQPSGILTIALDTMLTLNNIQPTPDSIVGNAYYFSYNNLFFGASMGVDFQVILPGYINMGDTINNVSSADILVGGNVIFTDVDSQPEIVTCAYDPNEKRALPLGVGNQQYITETDTLLQYTINFQNTGTDTARNVVIKDYLSDKFDYSTFKFITSKHPVNYSIGQNGLLTFDFANIYLPDSNVNYMGSQGYATFTIELASTTQPGDVIKNKAEIYFDQNPAIITNQVKRTIHSCDLTVPNFAFYNYEDTLCESSSGLFNLPDVFPQGGSFSGPGVNGLQFQADSLNMGVNTFYYNYTGLFGCEYEGEYEIYMDACLGVDTYASSLSLTIQPNPFNQFATLSVEGLNQEKLHYELYDLSGKKLRSEVFSANQEVIVYRDTLVAGMYILKISKEDNKELLFNVKLLVQ
ncbi:conserved repeat domain-containing protein/Por secretion system C-terminal sorting domain-containing protein [Lishizhenia tianjinensis]|uniref:Conserved repeat domain-containing protein/Por secretion system C-terminal sorting domain-containing protein n=1 Tax=Lishizhenia tianjinensis TaxID=477690 RepID=A0A1I6XFT6_9FLAO|nr:T9SS type A sorting domain-containing protein [Lishizhenia tianjinensis]SFT37016.1 conserved repeat domain-containing protein/Por secretion system C-terminal sorting domain-containing protein [Lishizhenia tianjinensis]